MSPTFGHAKRALLALAICAPVMANGWPFGGLVTMGEGCGRYIVIATPEGDTLARVHGGEAPKGGDELDGNFHQVGWVTVNLPKGGSSTLEIEAVDLSPSQVHQAYRQACERSFARRR